MDRHGSPLTRHALFVLAHQDDEVATASRMLDELRSGATVTCVFLTDGATSRAPSAVRDAESRAALTSLGVREEEIVFIGSELPIPDGALVEHLDAALAALEARMAGRNVTDVYCLAWEGGHQDHDASQLVAAAFAKRRGILERCLEMPLYRQAFRGRGFRVLSPPARSGWSVRRIALRDGWRMARLCRLYRSQRRSWLGLFPEAFLKLVVLRRELTRRVEPSRYASPPHARPLLYEVRFRFPWERFAAASAGFVARHGLV